MKKAIVTGAAGFIGSHMVELLLNEGYEVIGIDDMSNGQIDNISAFSGNSKYKFYKADLALDFDDSLFQDADYIFHMAALADIVPSVREPLKYHQANVSGTIRVLEAARKFGVKKLIYSASSSCYGIPDEYPTKETAEIRPQYPYAFTKYIGEQYALFWHQLYDVPVVSLRYFNVFGTRARNNSTYGAVFKVFLSQKLHGKPLTIVGDGEQSRDFTYVTDIASANLMAAKSDIAGDIFNIGSGNTYTVNYLARLIGGQAQGIPNRPGEPRKTHADITKAKEMLGWTPTISFEEGVRRMLKDIDYWRNSPVWDPESIKVATADWFKYLSKDEN